MPLLASAAHALAAGSGLPRPSRARRAADTRRQGCAQRLACILAKRAHEAGTVAMNPTVFVQAMLPHRELYLLGPDGRPVVAPTGGRLLATHYATTNGDFTLTVRAGLRRGPSPLYPQVSRGIPYGGLARLLLCHVITEARKRDSRTISLGDTITAFCERLDITPSGGAHGRLRYVVDQLQRLATCVVSFEWEALRPGRVDLEGENLLVVDSYHFWHREGSPTSEPVSGGTITLGGRFWEEVVSSCFPLDLRKAQFLRAHPTAYDLYLWLTYKLGAMERQHRAEVALSYDDLHAQLGSHYQTDADGALTPKGKKNFGYAVRHALRTIRMAWPTLDVSTPRGRIVLRATGPDVEHRASARRPVSSLSGGGEARRLLASGSG